jgi:hypothetical protein
MVSMLVGPVVLGGSLHNWLVGNADVEVVEPCGDVPVGVEAHAELWATYGVVDHDTDEVCRFRGTLTATAYLRQLACPAVELSRSTAGG